MDAIAVTLVDGNNTFSVDQVNAIDALTTGIITATVTPTETATELATLTGTGNALTIVVPTASVTAAQLNTINGATTLPVTVNSTTVTGTYADIITAYAANTAGTLTGLGNEAITPGAAVTVAEANALNALTTGIVTATISDGDMVTLAGLTDNLDSSGAHVNNGATPPVNVENAYTITVTDTTVAAAALNTLNTKTSQAITATAATTITGLMADLVTVFASGAGGSITGLGAEAVTVSDTGVLAAATLNTIDTRTTGVVTVSGVTGLTGLVADVNTAFAANGVANRIAGLADTETATITDTTVAAEDLVAANAHTSGLVTVQSTAIAGNQADVLACLNANAYFGYFVVLISF